MLYNIFSFPFFSVSERSLGGNWVDLIIILISLYFVLDSFRHDFFIILIEFLSFLFSLLLGFRFYKFIEGLLIVNFSLPNSIAKAIGFLIAVSVSEGVIASILFFLVRRIPDTVRKTTILNYFRFIVGFFDGVLLLSFIIPLTLAFPLPPLVKESISSSRLGGYLSEKTVVFEKKYSDIFGGILDEGLNLLTVDPESRKKITLNVSRTDLTIDYENEKNMLNLVNLERQKAGIGTLSLREEIVPVARSYAEDMWSRNYFSHYSPEGEDVVGRLEGAGIRFNTVGENLALAPTLLIAHNGLMNSEGHRRNILDPNFNKVAIGIVDNGIYGKIFVQIFAD